VCYSALYKQKHWCILKEARMAEARKRTSLADLTVVELPLVFNGKQYKISVLKTCYGDFLVQASHCASVLFETEEAVASENFRTVSKRCELLQHNNERIEKHIEVCVNFIPHL
jgi:hypothetical protein